jgi:hypothetical protein
MAVKWRTGGNIGEFESLVFPKNSETPQENQKLPSSESSIQKSFYTNQNPEEHKLLSQPSPRVNRLFRPS